MRSPFPGMDPYLEDPNLWPDVHHELITMIRRQLQPQLLPRFVALIRERLYLAEDESVGNARIHDARLEIVRPGDDEAVTIIEVLKPAHKAATGRGHGRYHDMRREVLHSGSHLVEIDLLRGGARERFAGYMLPACDYAALVSRTEKRPTMLVWRNLLSQQLPSIPVPLGAGDPDVTLDLQAALATAYNNAGYGAVIDYRRDPPPPLLSDDQRAWVHEVLARAGLR